jgi:hypothetical protein
MMEAQSKWWDFSLRRTDRIEASSANIIQVLQGLICEQLKRIRRDKRVDVTTSGT